MKPKVLHVCKSLDIGGTPKVAELFCKGLTIRDEFDIYLMHNAKGPIDRLSRICQFMPPDHILGYESEEEGEELIRRLDPDIVHVHRSGFVEWPEPGQHIFSRHFVETNIFGIIDQNHAINKTLFVSKWLYESRIPQCFRERMTRFDYVFNPIEEPCSQDNLRSEFGIENDTLVIGRVGRPDNGIYDDILTKALRRIVLDKDFAYKFIFLVLSPPPNMVEDLIKFQIPYEIVEPTVDEYRISSYYNTIDVLAHSRADGETCGCNIQEAMIHGVPVVTHWTEHFNSQVDIVVNGKTGFVSGHDYQQYANMLIAILLNNSLRESMSIHSKKVARDRFSLEKIISKLSSIYRELLI